MLNMTRNRKTTAFSLWCKWAVTLAVSLGALLGGGAGLRAGDIHVPADQLTIQDAIDAASAGDVIIVAPGTYLEHIVYDGKAVTIRSTDPLDPAVVAATIIDGGGGAGTVVVFFDGEGSDSVLEGMTVTGGDSTLDGGGIRIVQSSPVIRHCVIEGNTAANSGGGISITGSLADPLIELNIIRNNTATAQTGGGIACVNGDPDIFANEIHGNNAAFGGGIRLINVRRARAQLPSVRQHGGDQRRRDAV